MTFIQSLIWQMISFLFKKAKIDNNLSMISLNLLSIYAIESPIGFRSFVDGRTKQKTLSTSFT